MIHAHTKLTRCNLGASERRLRPITVIQSDYKPGSKWRREIDSTEREREEGRKEVFVSAGAFSLSLSLHDEVVVMCRTALPPDLGDRARMAEGLTLSPLSFSPLTVLCPP